jgi:DNA-binding NarL/FixJ family response regulator
MVPYEEGISPDLNKELRSVLLNCGPFDTDDSLRAIFVDKRIITWRKDLRTSNSQTQRVDAIIDMLYGKYNEKKENALVLLLAVLLDKTTPANACYGHLRQLMYMFEQASKSMVPIHVFVADDHIHALEGLRFIINQEEDMRVVGQANKKLDVLDVTPTPLPDVIVLDMAWPGDMSAGISFIPQLRNKYPDCQIIAITNYPELIEPARQVGAFPLRKGFSREELLDTIRYVVRTKGQINQVNVSTSSLEEPLTERERDVLGLLIQGITDKEIASHLDIAEGTVKKHVSNLLGKLGAKSRTEAAIFAERHRLL